MPRIKKNVNYFHCAGCHFISIKTERTKAKVDFNKMPAILALRVMPGLIHLFQLNASPIDKTILANGIV